MEILKVLKKQIRRWFTAQRWLATESLYGRRTVYHKYLQSEQWRQLRRQVLKRDGHKCKLCGSNGVGHGGLSAYHLTYKRIYREKMTDLITICRQCRYVSQREKQK